MRSLAKCFLILPLLLWLAACGGDSASEESTASAKAPERPPSQFHVTPKGTPEGNGSKLAPWDLQTALSHPSAVQPGDTIWIRGGTYKGQFKSRLSGSQVRPIVVRNFEGERVIIDDPNEPVEDSILRIDGAWTYYWGLEVTSSWPPRIDPPKQRAVGVNVMGPNNKLINMIVHDTYAVGFWGGFDGAEMYGNILYYNGQQAGGSASGHGLSAQNQEGTKLISDNISFQNFGLGMQMFGSETASLNNFRLEGNAVFNNGSISTRGEERNILLGGAAIARKPTLISNYTYWSKPEAQGQNNIGYLAGCDKLTARNNYFALGVALLVIKCDSVEMEGNTFIGSTSGWDSKAYANNTYVPFATKPTSGVDVFVRPNKYEPGRGHVIVFNWENKESVAADLKDVLKPGQHYVVRDVQNYFGDPVAKGTYDGSPVSIPVKLSAMAKPVGKVPVNPVHTSQEFGAFVVQQVAALPDGGGAPPAAPAKGEAKAAPAAKATQK